MARASNRVIRVLVAALLTAPGVFGQVRRVVIIKVDGLGEDVLKRYLNQTNPATGLKSSSTRVPHVGQTAECKTNLLPGLFQLLSGEKGTGAR